MNELETRLARFMLNSLKSGKVVISVDKKSPVIVEASEETIKITIPEPLFTGASFKILRHRLANFSILRRASRVLEKSPKRLDLYLDGEKVFSIGKGASSLFGNEKLYFTNLIRSFKH